MLISDVITISATNRMNERRMNPFSPSESFQPSENRPIVMFMKAAHA